MTYKCTASVSGSPVVAATWTASSSTLPLVLPNQVRFSSNDQAALTPMYWYAGKIDETTAKTISDLTSSLKALGMFFIFTYPSVPVIDD